MEFQVIGDLADKQVLWAVVGAITVDVVYDFTRAQDAPEGTLRNDLVFVLLTAFADVHDHVSRLVDYSPSHGPRRQNGVSGGLVRVAQRLCRMMCPARGAPLFPAVRIAWRVLLHTGAPQDSRHAYQWNAGNLTHFCERSVLRV
jgi:hypothetical protein